MQKKMIGTALVLALLAPSFAAAADTAIPTPKEQDFILTAYYSPLPGQCCYIKGSEAADKILNGNGTHGADGTAVYPGMLAAPPTYGFGTRIVLPGLGIMTVHDRGGAIQELEKAHRLDVWAGYGEEGLARALAFGVKRIRGTVYPKNTAQPEEVIDLAKLPAPLDYLEPYIVADAGPLHGYPKVGDRGLSVTLLQQSLLATGLLDAPATGLFGEETKKALAAFQATYGIEGDGTAMDEKTAAYLVAATGMDEKKQNPVAFVGKESNPADIQSAQRLLRYLGYYRGRTDGQYSDKIFAAILKYQQDQKLVGDAASPGAGRIGPMTRSTLVRAWRKKMVAQRAAKVMDLKRIADLLEERDQFVNAFLSAGQNGKAVKAVQELLAARGFFEQKSINGNFGPMTKTAVMKYQLERGLIQTDKDKGAGNIGPITLKRMQEDQVQELYRVVRAKGWESI